MVAYTTPAWGCVAKISHSGNVLPSKSFSMVLKKINLLQNQTCVRMPKDAITQNKHEKLNPGLVALYEIWLETDWAHHCQ